MVSRMDFVKQPFCALKPLFFEVPNACNESIFVGRQWLFREICEHLSSDLPTNRGVVIVGYPGTGKTTAVLQLVEHSCFGRASDSAYQGKELLNLTRLVYSVLTWLLCRNEMCSTVKISYHFLLFFDSCCL